MGAAEIGIATCIGVTAGGGVALYIFVSPEVATFALVALIVLVALVLLGWCAFSGLPGLAENTEKMIAAFKRLASNYAKAPGKPEDNNEALERGRLISVNSLDSYCEHLLWCAHLANDVYTLGKKTSPLFDSEFKSENWEFKPFIGINNDRHTVFAIYYKRRKDDKTQLEKLVIVVRGTETEEDVAQDIQAKQIDMTGETNRLVVGKSSIWGKSMEEQKNAETRKMFGNVQCHKGFHDRTMSLFSQLDKHLRDSALQINNKTSILCIGHSLGGAVATLTGMSLAFKHESTSRAHVTVVTFGAPRVLMDKDDPTGNGNADKQMDAFCNYFSDRLKIFRVQNQFDPVPTVPPLRYGPDRARHVTKLFIMLSSVKETALSFDDEGVGEHVPGYYRDEKEDDLIKIELRGRKDAPSAIEVGSMEDFLKNISFLTNANTHKMSTYIDRFRVISKANGFEDDYIGDAEADANDSWCWHKIWAYSHARESQRKHAKNFDLYFERFKQFVAPPTPSSPTASAGTVSLEQAPPYEPPKAYRFTNF